MPAKEHTRRKEAQSTVWAFVIVHPHPCPCYFACLSEAVEGIGVQDFLPVGSVETFHVGVLARLSLLNIHKIDTVGFAPTVQCLCHELRAVVYAYLFGPATPVHELGELAYHSGTGDTSVQRDVQRLAVVLVDDVEAAEWPAVHQRVTHEVHAPAHVRMQGLKQGPLNTRR